MSRYLPAFLLLLVPLSIVDAQQTPWQWVNPTPQGNILNGVWAISPDSAVAVGDVGTVVRTNNGGTTWQVQPGVAGFDDQMFADAFVDRTTGWLIGEFGDVLKTTDGGGTWAPQNSNTVKDLFALSFVSPTTGWASGADGAIIKTTNGGATWAPESSGTTQTLYGIHFISTTTGIAVGAGGTVVTTTNGGTSWIVRSSGTTQSLYGVQMISSFVAYAVGSFGIVLRTGNGGISWTPQTSGTDLSLFGLQFTSSLVGWAFGSYGTIIKTTNGGSTWFAQSSGTYNDLFGMRFSSATNGWAVGDFGVMLATTDGGTTWQPQSSGVKNTLNGVNFFSTTDGIAVGEEGTIIRTDDGGLSWVPQPDPTYQTLYGVFMASPLIGYAVGDSAVILKTINGGVSWSEQHPHGDASLYSIHFVNTNAGWAVGDFGTILHTSNGGTWAPQTAPTTTTLVKVRFLTTTLGWATGYSGTILKTTDGGTSWVKQTSNTFSTLNDIEIIDANTAYIVGDFGTILKTTNGGAAWTPQTASPTSFFAGVSFASPTVGWAAVDDGTVLATRDGGATWVTQTTPTQNTLWDVQYIPGTTGGIVFAVGVGGTVICSAVTPLPLRTWTGALDSLWTSGGNWNPIGVPEKLDSVYIPATAVSPVLRTTTQQVNLAALRIATGAKLTFGSNVAQLIVKGSCTIDGTLTLEAGSTMSILSGGNFLVNAASTFSPAFSTVIMTNQGAVRGTFYNLYVNASTAVQSLGNIVVRKNLTLMGDLAVRQVDTLTIVSNEAQAFQGPGIVRAGTIRRTFKPASLEQYRFESPVTYVQFYPNGTIPDSMTVTAMPNSIPAGFDDTLYVRRTYAMTAYGGSGYLSALSLRYDTSETQISIDNLSIFRDSSGIVKNIGRSDFLDSDVVAIELDTVTKFSTMYLGRIDYFPLHPYYFMDSLVVIDHGGARDTLTFGADPDATDGIDPQFDEAPLGPVPPSGTFDARFQIPSTNGSIVDVLPVLNPSNTDNIYLLNVQPGPGGYPMTLQWKSNVFPQGMVLLEDQATQGSAFRVNMKVASSTTIAGPSQSALRIIHRPLTTFNFGQGWNIVSLPLTPSIPALKRVDFPTAISNAFGYTTLYYIADTLKTGIGYWLKFASAQTIGIEGLPFARDTVALHSGWNLIGSVSSTVSIHALVANPPNVTTSNYFQYTGSYTVADSLRPGRGYWIKASGAGTLIVASGPEAAPAAPPAASADRTASGSDALAGLNSVTVTDRAGNSQTLYFTVHESPSFDPEMFALPPVPPDGAFDARFESGAMAEKLPPGGAALAISARDYPVKISWRLAEPEVRSLRFVDAGSQAVIRPTANGRDGSLALAAPSSGRILLNAETGPAIPSSFALKQNYPNPFNPMTTISFDLPEKAIVTIRVFDLLGREVARLADRQAFEAGSHAVRFNAAAEASGVYLCEFVGVASKGSEFRQVRKMLLLR